MLARYPEEATDLGLSAKPGLDDTRLNDLSPEYLAETASLAQDALDRLASMDLRPCRPTNASRTPWPSGTSTTS